jgi:hypothetical protein
MKPFSSIAIPHKDILEGKLTMDVFAADLWEVFKERAPDEYKDSAVFFRKTYPTQGIKNILSAAEKRLKGEGGDPIIQLQTPFGGGKTHSLIALYHKAKDWKAKVVVLDGTALDPKDTNPWEEIERQLTGKIETLKGKSSPGREKLKSILDKHQPVLILMDEILQYTTKAAGIKVGDSNLASQVLAFIQELTGTVKVLDKSLLILTLPSSMLEHYDEKAEQLFQQLQKISGRVEKLYAPVQEEEICQVIRKRLFSSVDEKEARKIIEEFLDYVEKEKILPEGVERVQYRDRFIRSYPFQPDVVDVLYKRWGSFPKFQRTRGVLRLLSLVVHSLKDSQYPFIRLGDFDLTNDEIKMELIKHIGAEYDSVIASDITSADSGAKKVDSSLGDAHSAFRFGTKAATSIFMYSHSGGPEKGASINEVKLSSIELSEPSSIVAEAVSKLRDNLFYIQYDRRYFFSNQPNLNRILNDKMESIGDEELISKEKEMLTSYLSKYLFEIFIWPENNKDIQDTKKIKLVVQRNLDDKECRELLDNYGERPRVYRNVLIFLCALDSERANFENFFKKKLAWQFIESDKTLNLNSEQKKEIKEKIKSMTSEVRDHIRSLYRTVLLPSKEGFKEIDLGIPIYGIETTIDKELYERLRTESEILERLAPFTLKEKYLKGKDYVESNNILDTFYKTPGEIKITSDEILRNCIREGVNQGLFGIGALEGDKPICRHFKEECYPELVEGELLIKAELCKEKIVTTEKLQECIESIRVANDFEELENIIREIPIEYLSQEQKEKIDFEKKKKEDELRTIAPPTTPPNIYTKLSLKLRVPSGKLSAIASLMNFLKSKFSNVNVGVEIAAQDGEISKSDYEDKVKEAFIQSDIIPEKEELE